MAIDLMSMGASFASGLGQSLGGGGGPSSAAQRSEAAFDSSGWNVSLGGGSIDSARSQSGEMSQYLPYVLVAVAGVVLWRMTRRKR